MLVGTMSEGPVALSSSKKPRKQPQFRNLQGKAEEINLVLLQPTVDLWKLRELALSDGGLVNDTLRKRAWPKLVGLQKYERAKRHETLSSSSAGRLPSSSSVNPMVVPSQEFEIDTALMPLGNTRASSNSSYADLLVQCMDVEQIERDVARCTWHLLTGSQRSRRNQIRHKSKSKKIWNLLRKKQRRLANLINLTLVESYACTKNDEGDDNRLRYYQGYHDVACIFLHALGGGLTSTTTTNLLSLPHGDAMGLELAARVLCQVSFSHFRDAMRNNFVSLQAALKICLYPLLALLDPKVHDHLMDCDMEPFFCLSWVLTWFSHDVRDTTVCKRLFDAFLASHPLLVVYMSLAMMLHPHNRQLILHTDCDFAALHQCLVSLPRNSCKVGWKRVGGEEGGYMSDDDNGDEEEDDDDDDCTNYDDATVSTDMETSSSVMQTPLSAAPSATSSANSNMASPTSTTILGPTTIEEGIMEQRVPFQDLIDTALVYMERYPPRCLEGYARRYYQHQEKQQQRQQGMCSSGVSSASSPQSNVNIISATGISLLQDPPTWSLLSAVPADWVLKQRLRQEMGLKATSRKDRRKKAQAPTLSAAEEEALEELLSSSTPDFDYIKLHSRDRAVIAAGYGLGPEAVWDRKRRRQRLLASVAVGFFAMTLGMALQYYYTTTTLSNSNNKSVLPGSSSSKALLLKQQQLNVTKMLATSMNATRTIAASPSSLSAVVDYCKVPLASVLLGDRVLGEMNEDENECPKAEIIAPPSTTSLPRPKPMVQNLKSAVAVKTEGNIVNINMKSPFESAAQASTNITPNGDANHWVLMLGSTMEHFSLKLVRFLLRPLRFLLNKLHVSSTKQGHAMLLLGKFRAWLEHEK